MLLIMNLVLFVKIYESCGLKTCGCFKRCYANYSNAMKAKKSLQNTSKQFSWIQLASRGLSNFLLLKIVNAVSLLQISHPMANSSVYSTDFLCFRSHLHLSRSTVPYFAKNLYALKH